MEFLRSANGCDSASQVRRLLDTDPSDGSSVSVETWECEATGAPLALYTLEGAEHSWPGAPRGGLFGGTPNRDIDASRVIWEFFSNL